MYAYFPPHVKNISEEGVKEKNDCYNRQEWMGAMKEAYQQYTANQIADNGVFIKPAPFLSVGQIHRLEITAFNHEEGEGKRNQCVENQGQESHQAKVSRRNPGDPPHKR